MLRVSLATVSILLFSSVELSIGKPVLILGSNYERAALIRDVLSPAGFAYKSSPDWVEPSQWKDYAAVVVGDESPQSLSATTAQTVRTYLENGGALLLTGHGLIGISGIKAGKTPDWLPAFAGVQVQRVKNLDGCKVVKRPEKGFAEVKAGTWNDATLSLQPAMGDLQIGDAAQSVAALQFVGKGFMAFVGLPLYRAEETAHVMTSDRRLDQLKGSITRTTDVQQRQQLQARMEKMEKQRDAAKESGVPDARSLEKLLENFLRVTSPSRADCASSAWVQAHHGDSVVWWQRDPQITEELYPYARMAKAPTWSPPEPAGEESVQRLQIEAARDDSLAVFVNATAADELQNVTTEWQWDGNPPNAPRIQVLQTGRLANKDTSTKGGGDIAGEAFWLRPASGSLAPGDTSMFCLRIDTAGVNSGKFAGTLRLEWAGGQKVLPVEITVHSVSFQEKDALELGFYGFNWLGVFPRDFSELGQDKPVSVSMNNAELVLANQRSLGAGAIVDGTLNVRAIRLEGDNQTLAERMEDKPGDLSLFDANGHLKKLDFSLLDEQIQAARKLGFTRINIRHGLASFTQSASDYVGQLTGAPYLSNLWKKTFVGMWSQYHDYLVKQGFEQFTFKFGDELSAESIKSNWLPIAHLAAEAGWMPETNPTGKAVDLKTLSEIQGICRSYSFNINFVDEFLKWKAQGEFTLRPDARLACYGSWGYYKSPAVLLRRTCWEAWAKGLDGLDVYTYARLFVFDGQNVYNPASAMGLLTGWHETSYLQQLSLAYQAAVKVGDHGEWVERAGKFLDVVRQGDADFRWQDTPNPPFPFHVRTLDVSTAQLDRRRAELLLLLDQAPDRSR